MSGFRADREKSLTRQALTRWAVGQLLNVYQMKDPVVSKQALLQVFLTLNDGTVLQWQAVRTGDLYK